MLNGDRPQMDVTPAVHPQCAPAGVVTWIYNHCRPYIRLPKWAKMPEQQKNGKETQGFISRTFPACFAMTND